EVRGSIMALQFKEAGMEPKDYSDKQLVDSAGSGAAVQWVPIEMMRRLKDSIEELDDSVNKFNNTTTKQQEAMIELAKGTGKQAEQMLKITHRVTALTWIIVFLTIAMLIVGIAQLFK